MFGLQGQTYELYDKCIFSHMIGKLGNIEKDNKPFETLKFSDTINFNFLVIVLLTVCRAAFVWTDRINYCDSSFC